MKRKLFNILMIVALLSGLMATVPAAAAPLPGDAASAESAPDAAGVARKAPIAIGAIRPAGVHHVRPRSEIVEYQLRGQGAIPLNATTEQVKAAVADYYGRFDKISSTWISPQIQAWALEREAQVNQLHKSQAPAAALAIQPVTITVLAMAVEFGATETFTLPMDDGNGGCVTQTVTITGPMQGEMLHPGPLDNQTLWYSPTQTALASFYEKLIFGYEGVGRVRTDLTDPRDGLPGINLSGYTVQDYYDHVAGDGNVIVTGTVQGWVTVPHSEGYYGIPPCGAGPGSFDGGVAPVTNLVVDALDVFSATNPAYYNDTGPDAFWPRYDANSDGIVDTFWIIHAGMDSQTTGDPNDISSHSGDMRNTAGWEQGFKVYEGDALTTADDIYVGPYTMQPENLDLGVLAEEFGHNFFGFPDMYVFDVNSNSIAFWNIMSDGVWAGYLGGSTPVGMPLWFRMIAACGTDAGGNPIACNWQEPMVERDYDAPSGEVTIGQLEKTPAGLDKGVRINLPDYTEVIENPAGDGKAAYSGKGRDQVDLLLSRQIAVGATATGTLTMDAYWNIEDDWDYGYVMVNGELIQDMDGVFTDSNPNGNNLGWGLTGTDEGTLRFDLSAYAGQTITLTLRYKTDTAATYTGWWIDNIILDRTVIEDFEAAAAPDTFPAEWTNSDPGWLVVPQSGTYQRYYLAEWRADTKYDKMVKTCYVTTNFSLTPQGQVEWVVERVPYNIPGALLYYRDTKYGANYAQKANDNDPPSYGPKYQILVVDMNPMPLLVGDTLATNQGHFDAHASSYDAALTLQPTEAFSITDFVTFTLNYPSKPAVTTFNDAKGYYAGYYWGEPCDPGYICEHDADGSAVIPARDLYSVRLTDFFGNRLGPDDEWLYGIPWGPSWLGSGNPGDDNVQFGINIELIAQDPGNTWGRLRLYNQAVTFDTTYTPDTVSAPGTYVVTYTTVVENEGSSLAPNVGVTYTLDAELTFITMTQESKAGSLILPVGTIDYDVPAWHIDELHPGDMVTLTVIATGTAETPATLDTQVDASYDMTQVGPWHYYTDIEVGPDLRVDKSGPAAAKLGDIITYTIALQNVGNMPAHSVLITDTLMAGTQEITQVVFSMAVVPVAYSDTLNVAFPVTVYGVTLTNHVEVFTPDTQLTTRDKSDSVSTWVEGMYKIYLPIVMKNN